MGEAWRHSGIQQAYIFVWHQCSGPHFALHLKPVRISEFQDPLALCSECKRTVLGPLCWCKTCARAWSIFLEPRFNYSRYLILANVGPVNIWFCDNGCTGQPTWSADVDRELLGRRCRWPAQVNRPRQSTGPWWRRSRSVQVAHTGELRIGESRANVLHRAKFS